MRLSDTQEERSSSIERQSAYDASVMKEGYLQKKGQLLKGWKRRWFVCDGRTLAYYISHKDKKPNAVIPLDACTVQDGGISETWNSPRIYLTDGTIGTMYCLSAEDGAVATEWLQVLQKAAAAAQNTCDNSKKRIAHAPSKQQIPKSPKKRQLAAAAQSYRQIPTNLKLEKELSKAFETIEALLNCRTHFQLQGVHDGVRMSLYCDSKTKRLYARGSVVIRAPPDMVLQVVSDASRRGEWDIQFPQGSVVASYGATTELVHLSGSCRTEAPMLYSRLPIPSAASLGALLGAATGYVLGTDLSVPVLSGVGCGAVASSLDCTPWTNNRDMLLVVHIRDHADGSYFVVERSVVNELKPTQRGVVRAETSAGGYLIQPIDVHNNVEPVVQTLLTYVTDVDIGGWVPKSYKKSFLLERVKNLANIREYVVQDYVFGLRDDDDLDDTASEIMTGGDGLASLDEGEEEGTWNPSSWRRGMVQLQTGGLKLTDKEITKKQKGVLMEVLKSFGAAILEGKSAVSLSLPVRIFEPRSMLERIVDLWLYAPVFLTRAAVETDPIERFKLVMCFAFAGLHHGVCPLKPFNPILGETYQTQLEDGSLVFCEHTSHHPPISNFQIFGKGYMVWGYFIFGGAFKTNALTQNQIGPIYVDFDDGTRVKYNMPYLRHGGFLWGDRIVEILGQMNFQDETNGLSCELRLNPDEKKGMGGMFSASKTPSDYCRGVLMSGEDTEICQVTGSWLSELKFDDTVVWDLERDVCQGTTVLPNVLSSDSRYREDLLYVKRGDLDEAQEWKVKLEKLQRADRAIRKEGRKSNHWAIQSSDH